MTDALPEAWRGLTTDPTLKPDLTVRPDDVVVTTRVLPQLSVDLRVHDGPAAAPLRATDLEVCAVLGEGGMGRVLLARQHSLVRDVAVKTALPNASPSAREAILEEGAITGQLEHPAIVPVHALGLDAAGWPAMVMKRIEGVAWDALLADPAHPGWEGWEGDARDRLAGHLQIVSLVCNALHFAHSKGVVHRDVKPANVLIGRFGDVYLADWGVAGRLGTRSRQVCGTPAYMAPEMVTGEPVDARTDVYLLGAVLHVVLTGRPRHEGSSMTEALLHARSSPPCEYGPEVPRELGALCNRACHVDPAQRPQSAQAFRDELARYLRHRDARALGEQAVRRVGELEALLAQPARSEAQEKQVERLLLEARFGLEQSLLQWADNLSAQEALARLDAIVEQRRQRAVALEREARERDPAIGARSRTLGLAIATLITLGSAVVAARFPGDPTPATLVTFPVVVIALFLAGTWVLRRRLLGTRFNRQVYLCMMSSLALMIPGRVVGLFFDIPLHEHFVRDAWVACAVMLVCAITLLRWTAIISLLFAVAGVLCQAFPARAIDLYSGATVAAMCVATVASLLLGRRQA